MSKSHKNSKLILKEQIIPAKFNTFYIDCQQDGHAIYKGSIVSPKAALYTLREEEGVFGDSAIAIEEGTINEVSQIINNHNSNLISEDVSEGEFKGWKKVIIQSITNINNFRVGKFDYVSVLVGSTWTFSIDFYSPSDKLWMRVDGTNGFSAMESLGNYKASFTLSNGGTDKNESIFIVGKDNQVENLEVGDFFYYRNVQIEQKNFPTSFANNSRESGVFRHHVDFLKANNEFTISMRAKCHDAKTSSNYYFDIGDHGLYLMNYGTNITLRGHNGSISQDVVYSSGRINEWVMLTVVKSGSKFKLYVDGEWIGENELDDMLIHPTFHIGTNYNGGSYLNGLISHMRVDSIVCSSEEIEAWYLSNAPFYSPYDYRSYAL
ncbi:LamG domain-containing protein [Chengkuizengella axinellae]|uniref:LamG domain-containing protein n=1 Tax=Chengkuizengella axinellae TaxID=3064388 RepID=A0ABT9IWE0_9BACL|nr:LamG domain-containing protein [Chengkuizengella sp. 2205SS18-9]MDP5273683.1 LamG domain-containing protein [Chengkuizengella sp. 2205SS18-9]